MTTIEENRAAFWPFCREVASNDPSQIANNPVQLDCGNLASAIQQFSLKLYPLAISTAINQFEPQIFALLRRFVVFDAAWIGCASITHESAHIVNSCITGLPRAFAAEWNDIKGSSSTLAYFRNQEKALSAGEVFRPWRVDTVANTKFPGTWERLIRYSISSLLTCCVKDPHASADMRFIFLSIFSLSKSHPVSEIDVMFFNDVLPHIVSAININRQYQLSRIKGALIEALYGLAIVDSSNVLYCGDQTFYQLMELEWPNWDRLQLPSSISLSLAPDTTLGYSGKYIDVNITHVEQLIVVQVRQRSVLCTLSEREQQVLRLFVSGLGHSEVAKRLFIASATVKTHLNKSYRKLGVTDKAQAASLLNGDAKVIPVNLAPEIDIQVD